MIKHTIDGYDIELELDVSYDGGPPRTQCYVSKVVGGRLHSASLEALGATGEMVCMTSGMGSDYFHQVPEAITSKIEEWAEANGY